MVAKNIFLFCLMIMLLSDYLFAQNNFSKMNSVMHEGLIGSTEVRYWDSVRAPNGYTLFGARGKTYLIDMEGYIINQWNTVGTNPRFVAGGNILDALSNGPSGFSGFKEVNWAGNIVWQYLENRSNYFPHHDWTRIFNKKLNAYTTIYIANKTVTHAQAIAAGCNPSNGPYNNVTVDAIVEVDMNGNIVWEWWFFDHIIQDFDSTKPNYVGSGQTIADYPGKININLQGKPLKKDWLHCNSIDYNDTLDQIVVNSVHGEFYIIDHGNTFIPGNPAASIALAATSAGDFLYRFGDPARYNQGDPPSILPDWTQSTTGNKQIGGSHHVHWIKPGLPGAGNILIFNNGEYLFERVSQSYIFEVNPYYDSNRVNTSAYVNPPDAGYYTWVYPNKDAMKQNKLISKQVVWIYNSKNDQSFFSTIGSSEQRLPNGNILICSDSQGHIFEVTFSDTIIVWEYINSVTQDGIKQVIKDQYPMYNSVFRAYRYYADDPALVGKDLTRKGTITGKTPNYFTPDDLLLFANILEKEKLDFLLQQNFPNPFNPSTTIKYLLIKESFVSLKIFDILGKEIVTLVNEDQLPGSYSITFNALKVLGGNALSAGLYLYRIASGDQSVTKKMLLVK